MTENSNAGKKGALLVLGGCLTTIAATIFLLAIATIFFIDTTKCSSVGRALPVLWGLTAVVFLTSVVVIRVIAWKVIRSTNGRWVTLAVYGFAMLISFVVIALALLMVFNC